MRCFERMLRRAGISFASTQGFNPKPRLVFGLSLALGIVGCQEVVELELEGAFDPEDVRCRLNEVCPPGLAFLSARALDAGQRARVTRVVYQIYLAEMPADDLDERITAILKARSLLVNRARPRARTIDLRPFVRDVRREGETLVIDLSVSPAGGARPEEVLGLLGFSDALEKVALIERTVVEVEDEAILPADAGALT